MKNIRKNVCVLLSVCLSLLPCAARAAPQNPPFPPTAPTLLSLPEKGPLPVDATVDGLPVTLRGSKVIIDAGSYEVYKHLDLEKNALAPFTEILKAYPHARFFDFSWYIPITLSAASTDILYDRAKHTVTVDWDYGGGMDPIDTGTVRFASVREAAFAAILRAHPKGMPENDPVSANLAEAHDNTATNWGGFQYLYQARYGCRVRVLRARHQMHL